MKNNNTNNTTAVFIDGDWLYSTTRRINRQIDYAKFFSVLIKNFGAKTKVHFYGTVNPTDKKQVKFYTLLKRIGYVVHYVELTKRGDVFIPKGLDVELAVNAMRVLPSLKKFVLVSGDSDFVPLLKQAINFGVGVSVVALPFTTGYLLRKIVGGSFLNLETLIEERKSVKKLPIFKKEKKKEFLVQNSLYIEKGDYYESYLNIRNLMISAKGSITIIDSYIDDQILTMIKLLKIEINVIIFTPKTNPADFCVQVKKLRDEGRLITVHKTKVFHDRFLGIDNVWWHSGHSFKDLGEKDSMMTKVAGKVSLDKLKASVERESQNLVEICK